MPEPHVPSRSPESPIQEHERLCALVVEQAALIEQLRERIQELEARLAQDSHNSSKPPSSDHRSGNHRRGRSANRAGASREAKRVAAALPATWSRTLTGAPQVVEVVIQRAVTEHRIVGGTCTCGRVQRSAFPEGVTATVQYGPGVLALAVYLTQPQLLPYQRTAELFQELAGIALSPGTLQRAVTVAATHLEAPVAAIRGALLTAPVPHADETGVRVDGDLHGCTCSAPRS